MRDGWSETSLGEIAEVIGGGTPPTSIAEYWDGDIVWLTPTEIASQDGKVVSDSIRKITDLGLKNSGARVLPRDSVILTSRASVGYVALAGRDLCTNQGFQSLIPKQSVLSKFLMFWIQQNRPEFESRSAGSTFKEISKSNVKGIKLLLPPLPEQKRIVDLISSVDFYIEALHHQLESAKKSRNAVLHELLTAGGDNWVETTLGEVADLNPEQARDYDSDRLIKYIDLSTVTFDTGISTEIKQLPFNKAPGRARRIIREKDVIVSTVRPYLKGFAFVAKEFNGQIASTGFCVIRAKSESILSELIWALVGSDDFVDFLIRRSTGSNYPAVRPSDISDFTFMLPPLHDQVTVSNLITAFDETIRASVVLIDSAKNLRSGLLSNLLSGENQIPDSYDKVIGAA